MAALDGVLVGMGSGIPGASPSVVELISMWVAPTARGRGVGDALVMGVIVWARGFVDTGELTEPSTDGRRETRMRCVLTLPARLPTNG